MEEMFKEKDLFLAETCLLIFITVEIKYSKRYIKNELDKNGYEWIWSYLSDLKIAQ